MTQIDDEVSDKHFAFLFFWLAGKLCTRRFRSWAALRALCPKCGRKYNTYMPTRTRFKNLNLLLPRQRTLNQIKKKDRRDTIRQKKRKRADVLRAHANLPTELSSVHAWLFKSEHPYKRVNGNIIVSEERIFFGNLLVAFLSGLIGIAKIWSWATLKVHTRALLWYVLL